MKSLIRMWARLAGHIRQKQFYYRLLFFYGVLSVTIVSVVVGSSFTLLGKRYEQEIKSSNRHVLGQVAYLADQNLYGTMVQIINDYILNDYFNVGISRFYAPGIGFTSYDCYKYFQTLSGLTSKNDFIHSITLYRKNPGYLVDSRYGLAVNPEADPGVLDRSFPFSGYLSAAAMNERLRIITPEQEGGTWPYLTVIRQVPLYGPPEDNIGFFAIALDPQALWEKLDTDYGFQNRLFVIDGKGTVILNNLQDEQLKNLMMEKMDSTFFNAEDSGREVTVGGVKYDFTWMTSAESGWRYVSVIPMKTLVADSIAVNRKIFVIAAVLTLLAFLSGKMISVKLYRPLDRLHSHALRGWSGSEFQDDISAINGFLAFYEEKVDDMQKTISQSAEVLAYKSMIDILYRPKLPEEEIRRRFAAAGIPFGKFCGLTCLLVSEIDSNVFFSLSLEQQEYIAVKISEFIKGWVGEPVLQVSEFRETGRVVTLLGLSDSSWLNLLEGRGIMLRELQSELHVKVNILISCATEHLKDFAKIYKEAAGDMQYSYLCGFGNVFLMEELQKQNENYYILEPKQYHEFENCLKTARFSEAVSMLDHWEQQIMDGRYGLKSVKNFAAQLFNLCVRIEKERMLLRSGASWNEILSDYEEAASFSEAVGCIRTYLFLCTDTACGRNHDSKLIRSVMDYIREHCEEEETLTSIADSFEVSPSHLSRTFKTVAGCNLSSFLLDCKLEKAAEALAADSQLTAAGVAEKFGYYTPAYFTRLFKTKFGVTPYQYQRMHQSAEEDLKKKDTDGGMDI